MAILIHHLSPACWRLLCEAFGGSRIYIPKAKSGEAWQRLVDALGEDYAGSVIRWGGGEALHVPKVREAKPSETIAQLLAEGVTPAEIAQLTFPVRFSERHIRRIDRERRAEPARLAE
jgi:Mor family transcriptional regulator